MPPLPAIDAASPMTPTRQSLASPPCSPVAVLFARADSNYKAIEGVDVWDMDRDARNWPGGCACVAHPPCRAWGRLRHFANPRPDEKDLAIWAVQMVREWGGVLEHPAHSRLFAHCDLPRPGEHKDGMWTAEVLQAWWGDTRTKKTWLCFFGIAPEKVYFPFKLHDAAGDRRRWQVMSKHQRSATNPAMAEWLIQTAAQASPLCSEVNVKDHSPIGAVGASNTEPNSAAPIG